MWLDTSKPTDPVQWELNINGILYLYNPLPPGYANWLSFWQQIEADLAKGSLTKSTAQSMETVRVKMQYDLEEIRLRQVQYPDEILNVLYDVIRKDGFKDIIIFEWNIDYVKARAFEHIYPNLIDPKEIYSIKRDFFEGYHSISPQAHRVKSFIEKIGKTLTKS